jgi:hypothetical protein
VYPTPNVTAECRHRELVVGSARLTKPPARAVALLVKSEFRGRRLLMRSGSLEYCPHHCGKGRRLRRNRRCDAQEAGEAQCFGGVVDLLIERAIVERVEATPACQVLLDNKQQLLQSGDPADRVLASLVAGMKQQHHQVFDRRLSASTGSSPRASSSRTIASSIHSRTRLW